MKIPPNYEISGQFDEYLKSGGTTAQPVVENLLSQFSDDVLHGRQAAAMEHLRQLGITFNVYGHDDGVEKVWPVDILPRVIGGDEWSMIENGLKQRIRALNLFLDDIYGGQRIIAEKILPESLLATATSFREVCRTQKPPHGVWTHVTGTDLIRHSDGVWYVLEDNLRCPSGVSYVLENREVMKRVLPELFRGVRVAPVEDYPELLLKTLIETAPEGVEHPTVVLLTPGVYNSAYFEHCFLAQQMGVELVCGDDLSVQDGYVQMRTTKGPQRVDVIYRRIDDDFLDPACFREDSMLGVPGLMDVYWQGNVTLANAPGKWRCRRQGDLRVRSRNHSLLFGRRTDSRERSHSRMWRRKTVALRARTFTRAGYQADQRIGRLRNRTRANGPVRKNSPGVKLRF